MIPGFLPPAIFWLAVLIYGLALGSFTTCVIYRLPRRLSLWRRSTDHGEYRSFCPLCRHVLAVGDLIPVLSWVMRNGKCRYCGAAIGWVYPIVETIALISVSLLFYFMGLTVLTIILTLFIPVFAGIVAFFVFHLRS